MSLIYVTSPIHETILSRLADLGEVRLGYGPNAVGYEEIRNQVDAVFLRGGHISAEMIAASPKLRIVARHGAGYDNVDYKAAADYGVWVTNTPGANQRSVIEHRVSRRDHPQVGDRAVLGDLEPYGHGPFEVALLGEAGVAE